DGRGEGALELAAGPGEEGSRDGGRGGAAGDDGFDAEGAEKGIDDDAAEAGADEVEEVDAPDVLGALRHDDGEEEAGEEVRQDERREQKGSEKRAAVGADTGRGAGEEGVDDDGRCREAREGEDEAACDGAAGELR